jgi:D-alanyl-D-alanine carboxypeptidase/D-alanyl-D-alanine-endopeptidase (penicillin-binding protein 4)
MLANLMGGGAGVMQRVRQITQIPAGEIQLRNGSGLGIENRLSPRAITAMLIATQRYLQPRNLTIADIYPVMGRDGGTLKSRVLPPGSTVKTGTLNEVSALAGVMPTRDRGLIWFAVINLGAGDLEDFHQQQDRLLQNLQKDWGTPSPLPPSIQPSRSTNPGRLGAAERNELM